MPQSVTYITKQYLGDIGPGGGAANPGDLHIPLGKWPANGWITRAILYAPISFSGITNINFARLYLNVHAADGTGHVNGTGSNNITIRRTTASWGETYGGTSSAIDETWGGGSAGILTGSGAYDGDVDQDINADAANGTELYVDISNTVRAWFNGAVNHGVKIEASGESSSADALEFYSRHATSAWRPYILVDYDTNTAPNAPTGLSPIGNQVVNTGTTVNFSGTRSDPDSGDYITGVTILIYEDDGTTLISNNALNVSGTGSTFNKSVTVPEPLKFYRWKARTRDRENVWGPYSALQRFMANSVPNAPSVSINETPSNAIKTLTPTISISRVDPDSSYGDSMLAYELQIYSGNNRPAGTQVWTSGQVTTASGTVSVQRLYNGPALAWRTTYYAHASTKDSQNAWGPFNFGGTLFTTYSAPIPVNLTPTGDTVASGLTPTLTGIRGDSEHTIASYQIQLYENDGSTLKWDSGTLSTGITNGASFSKQYNGPALSFDTNYKWRARIVGNIGGTSSYTALQTFKTPLANAVVQTAPVGSPITSLTPAMTGTWTENLNARQIRVYAENGTTLLWDSGEVTQTAAASFNATYAGTALQWNTSYKWQVRVRRAADNLWQPYSGLTSFTTDSAGAPVLTAPINNSWQTTLTPTFTGTTFNAEVITTYRILLYENNGTTLVWDSGDLVGSGTSFSKLYNGSTPLIEGRAYKWQARYVKSTGPTGNYSPQASFHINDIPQEPSNRLPSMGAIIVNTLTPTFTATFEDTDITVWGDTPLQMEIEVRNNATDALIATQTKTTGLVAGTNNIVWDGTPALVYETVYKWRVRYRDSKSVDGAWSQYNTFKPSQASSITIIGPSGTIVSPQVPVSWAFSSPGGKAQGTYRVRVIRNTDSIVVYDSGVVVSNANNHVVPGGYLQNNVSYTFEVTTADVDGI